jgi:DNA-binding CsgD family transcriptional regulator
MGKKETIKIVLEGTFNSSQENLRKEGIKIKVKSKLLKKILKKLKK